MPRIRVHYACGRCGHKSSAEYFDYRYHETEAVRSPCDGCGFMTEHTPQSACRIQDPDRNPSSASVRDADDGRPRLATWRKFYQHGFTFWRCSRCGVASQSVEQPEPCDCSD